MSRASTLAVSSTLGGQSRLGRALFYVYQQAPHIRHMKIKAMLGQLIAAGEAMEFAVKLKDHGTALTGAMAVVFANDTGISESRLFREVLPNLKNADLINYVQEVGGYGLASIEEFVGLSANVIDQAMRVAEIYGPTDVEWGVLHSTELASWAPMTMQQHKEQLSKRGFVEATVTDATRLTLAAGINQKVTSAELNEDVIYNPNVWAAHHVSIGAFLKTLPPAERDSLLGLCEQASNKPGLVVDSYKNFSPKMLSSARKVGLIQAATVKSSGGAVGSQTYVFSPMLESDDDKLRTTEVLHHRKLFVAHILYGHEKATFQGGRICDPVVLVRSLLHKGCVGPASNIATDYHLLEASGIVSVRESHRTRGRAYLDLVKREIVEGGLGWLEASRGSAIGGSEIDLGSLKPPNVWSSPEADRVNQPDSGAENEIAEAAILRLREAKKEAASVARHDSP